MLNDFALTIQKMQAMGQQFFKILPNLVIGVVVFVIFLFLSRLAKKAVGKVAWDKRKHSHLGLVLGRVAQGATVTFGLLLAATSAFPSFNASNLFASLGVGTVAIGFAFRDILQNYLAGILLLLTEPFRIGDQIVFDSHEGTVDDIQTRATIIRTYDGRRVVIPNGSLFTQSVQVNTAFTTRRTQFDVGIGYGDNISKARQLMLDAIKGVDGVRADPSPDVLVVSLSDFSVNLRARWWSASQRADQLRVQDLVLEAVKRILVENGIDLPFPTQQILFHDQTEKSDGNRAAQREGWPARPGSDDASTGDSRRSQQFPREPDGVNAQRPPEPD